MHRRLPGHHSQYTSMEIDGGGEARASLAGILGNRHHRILLLKIAVTLTLGIMGGAILPVAWGFQQTGIVYGFLLMIIVSFANDFTCGLLLRQATVMGAHDYGSLSESIGGKFYKVFTEISIVVLLLGSIIGTIQQYGEAGAMGLEQFSTHMPGWLVGRSGSLLMALGVFCIVLPLCMYSKMKQLDKASFVGFVLVWWLIIVVVIQSIKKVLPAIGNKQFAATRSTNNLSGLSQATSIFGYCFFIQPMMMPFLGEIPQGKMGICILKWATRLFVLGLAFIMYGLIGFFGAAKYGVNISDNILQNKWLGGGTCQGILNMSITIYLVISVPVLEFPIRQVFASWFVTEDAKKWQSYAISFIILGFSLGISVAFPDNSGKVIVVTGAVGVLVVAYVVPIVNHFRLIFLGMGLRKIQVNQPMQSGNLVSGDIKANHSVASGIVGYKLRSNSDTLWRVIVLVTWEYVVPVLVILVGAFFSVMSLYSL